HGNGDQRSRRRAGWRSGHVHQRVSREDLETADVQLRARPMKRILPLLLTLTATTANAQVLSQTAGQTGTATRFGGGIALSSVEYEEDRDFEVERKVLVGHMLLPLETDLALIGQAGFIFDSEIDDLSGVDDGK